MKADSTLLAVHGFAPLFEFPRGHPKAFPHFILPGLHVVGQEDRVVERSESHWSPTIETSISAQAPDRPAIVTLDVFK